MKIKSAIILGALLLSSCQNKEASSERRTATKTAEPANSDAVNQEVAAEEQRDEDIQESSLAALSTHMDDIVSLREAALGAGQTPEFPEIFSSANSLVTHYDFEVKKALEAEDFRMAAYQWDLGEIHYKRIEKAVAEGSVSSEVGAAWGTFVGSREEIMEKKEVWNSY